MQGAPASLVLFGLAVAAYALALLGFILHLAFKRRYLADGALALVLVGWPLHAASILTRAFEAGHWPLGNMYEYSTGISFVVITASIVLMLRLRMRLVGLPAVMVAIALMGVAYMLYEPPGQLVPALHSYWLTMHVTAMATASGLLSFSFFFGMGYLARRWADSRALASVPAGIPAAAGTDGTASIRLGGGIGGALAGQSPSGTLAQKMRRILPAAGTLDLLSYR